jgi:Delta14-sterol reductase
MLMSVGIALAADYTNPMAWLYTVYYVLLLVTRERDDDWRCEQKYGPEWVEYRKRVPYRIVPYLY